MTSSTTASLSDGLIAFNISERTSTPLRAASISVKLIFGDSVAIAGSTLGELYPGAALGEPYPRDGAPA